MEPDYSTYRLQLKSMKPDLDEKQIYQMYNGVMKPGRSTQTTPYLAEDGYYHGLYLTECLDDGRIYIGKHSTDNLDDGYQGSGYEINDGKNLGKKFKTTWLEFFDSSDQAYVAEKGIVNANFIRNQKLVMNHALGGKHLDDPKHLDDSKHDAKHLDDVKKHLDDVKPEVVKPEFSKKVEPFKTPNPDRIEGKGTKKRGSTFSDLGVHPGEWISFIEDESKKFKVIDDWHIDHNGRTLMLKRILPSLTKKFYGNPLSAFTYNGKCLAVIQKELRSN